jgi:putative transposase
VESRSFARDQKKCRELNATLVFQDESGYSLVCPLKRTWSRRGQTPISYTSINHHQRLNLVGAVIMLPNQESFKLSVQSHWKSITGQEILWYLKQLLRCVAGPIVMVWDNHPIHKRKMVQEFIAQQERLIVFQFPTAAPELNPAEYLWTQVSQYYAGRAPHDRIEMKQYVMAGVARIRRSQDRIRGCLQATRLDWF